MDDIGLYDCPMPETFRDKLGMTLTLAWLYYLGFVSRVLLGPLMPAIQTDLGFSHAEAGGMFLMLSVGFTLAPICSGLFSSRINHLGTLKLSAWTLGLALLPLALVERLWAIHLILVLIGFAGSLHLPSAIATITAEIQQPDWGKGLAVHQCAPPLSFVSAPLIAALLLQWLHWRQVVVCWAVLALVSALLYTLFGRGGEFPGRVVSPVNVRKVVCLPSFWIMVLLLAMAMAGNAGIVAMLPLFFVSERGFELGWANTLIGLSQISGLAVVLAAGPAIDRIGMQRFMKLALCGAAMLTMAVALCRGWLLLFVLFVQPAVLTAFFPGAFAALARIAHPTMRSVTSALGPPLAFLIGAGLVPSLIGRLGESFSLGTGIFAAGCFMLGGPLLVGFLRLGDYEGEQGC